MKHVRLVIVILLLLNNQYSFAKDNTFNIDKILNITLVSMEVSDDKSKNPYEKYSYNFLANCYGCNAANIVIKKDNISFIGSCYPEKVFNFKVVKIENDGNKVILKIKDSKIEPLDFTIEKINDAPIFKVKLSKPLDDKQITIQELYTTETELNKFMTHDCGEFDG